MLLSRARPAIHPHFNGTLLILFPVQSTSWQDGWTNLHYAAVVGNADLVCMLITARADVEAKNMVGTPPLLVRVSVDSVAVPAAPPLLLL